MAVRTIFDHIAKTAGTSVKEAIAAAIGERSELVDQGYPHHIAVTNAGQRRFIGCHMWFYPGERLAAGWYYSTVLRDPSDRFLSQYYFHRQHREDVLNATIFDPVAVAAVHQDLDSYLADNSPDVRRSYSNFQAYHFACRMCDRPDDLSERQLLDAAIASLEDYDLVGVHSDIQGFVDAYCQAMGVPNVSAPRLNVTSERKGIDALPNELKNKLFASNTVDIELYHWARSRFFLRHRNGIAISSPGSRQTATEAAELSFGTREIQIVSVTCQGRKDGLPQVTGADRVDARLTCLAKIGEPDLTVGVAIRNSDGNVVASTNTKLMHTHIAISEPQEFTIHIGFSALLAAGDYKITVALHKGITHLDGCYHWLDDAARFRVAPGLNADGDVNASIAIEIREMARHSTSMDTVALTQRTAVSTNQTLY